MRIGRSAFYDTPDTRARELTIVADYAGTPINERHYPNARLATALSKAEAISRLMDGLGYNCFWLAEHHFQPEGTECIPNTILMALHLAHRTKNIKIGAATPEMHKSPFFLSCQFFDHTA
jgi:alkanesulfonate monooxygenase SsuD/methylene tetrahydromethanopterin reductase-like flavin-dependent oxidoreductase (luciferase family)